MKLRQRQTPRTPRAAAPEDAYHHGDLRRAFLDAALEVIATEGRHALSLRELSRRVGVSHAAPYRHFATRESLLAALAEEGFRALKARMELERTRADDDFVARFAATGLGWVLFAVEHPAHFQVMSEALDCREEERARVREAAVAASTLLLTSIVEGQQAGAFRAGDPEVLALHASSALHGLAHLLVGGALGDRLAHATPRALAAELTAQVLEGLRPHQAAKKR